MGQVPDGLGSMKARPAGKEGLLTPEQRDLLKKQIDARVRERMSDRKRAARTMRGRPEASEADDA